MLSDKAIEFEAEILKVNNILENIASLGIDVSADIKLVEEIKKEINEEVKKTDTLYSSNVGTMKESSFEFIYLKGISKLQELEQNLKVHDVYFMGKGIAESLEMTLTNEFLSGELIASMADAIIVALDKINASDTRSFSSEEKIVNKLYELAYKICLIEIRLNKTSKVLNWAKRNNSVYFNNLVRDKIDAMDILSDKTQSILLNIYSNEGLDSNYLNEELIKSLARENVKVDANDLEDILKALKQILKEINDYNQEIINKGNKLNNSKDRFEVEQNSYRKSIFRGILSTFIITSVLVGGFKISTSLTKGLKAYEITTKIYSDSEFIKPTISTEFIYGQDDALNVVEYSPWVENSRYGYERTITKYDVTGMDFEEVLANYKNLDFYDLEIIGEKSVEYNKDPEGIDIDELIRVVERITKDETKVKNGYQNIAVVGLMIAVIALLALLEVLLYNCSDDYGIANSIENIFGDYSFKDDLKKEKELIKKLNAEIIDDERKRKVLEDKFIELYEMYQENIEDEKLIRAYKRLKNK